MSDDFAMIDEFDDDPDFDNEEEFEFDCHMDRSGQCGMAGSEECDFECPVMASIIRRDIQKKKVGKNG